MAGLEERLSKLESILHRLFCCDTNQFTGPPGPPGPPGGDCGPCPPGPPGPQGPAGPAGLNWEGEWVPCTVYSQNDAVGYNGASYFVICETSDSAPCYTYAVTGTGSYTGTNCDGTPFTISGTLSPQFICSLFEIPSNIGGLTFELVPDLPPAPIEITCPCVRIEYISAGTYEGTYLDCDNNIQTWNITETGNSYTDICTPDLNSIIPSIGVEDPDFIIVNGECGDGCVAPTPSNMCFFMGGETPGGNYFCSTEPEIDLLNGKPYYKLFLPDCSTPFVLDIEPIYVWFSTSGDYVNKWVVSELNNATIGNVFSYIPSVIQEYFPIGAWQNILGDQFYVYDSSIGDCSETICFSIYQKAEGNETPIAYQVELPISGNAPFQNGRPVYNIVGDDSGTVYWDGDEWIYASQALAPLLQPLNNVNYYPIGNYPEWGSTGLSAGMYSSTLGTCLPPDTCFTFAFEALGAGPSECTTQSLGFYASKPYYELLLDDCTTPIGAFIWWNDSLNQWNMTTAVGDDSGIKMYNEYPGFTPESSFAYPWVHVSGAILDLTSTLGPCFIVECPSTACVPPDINPCFALLASQGAVGPQGPPGLAGEAGLNGNDGSNSGRWKFLTTSNIVGAPGSTYFVADTLNLNTIGQINVSNGDINNTSYQDWWIFLEALYTDYAPLVLIQITEVGSNNIIGIYQLDTKYPSPIVINTNHVEVYLDPVYVGTGVFTPNKDYTISWSIHGTGNGGNALTPFEILNQLEMSFDWKKGSVQDYTRVPADMPQGVTNNQHTRNGFVGYGKPIEVAGNVVHPQFTLGIFPQNEKLIEAYIYNLGVKIKDYSTIANYNPVLVISKYKPSMSKAPNNPTPTFPDRSWSKGSYKFSQDNDTVRLTRVPIQASYQVIDFGQEHYFRTSKSFQSSSSFDGAYDNPLLRTRGCKRHNHQTTPLNLYSKAFVYLQFHIEITVEGNTYLSAPLGRLKMLLEFKPLLGENYSTTPGGIINADFNTLPYQTTRIYYKHT